MVEGLDVFKRYFKGFEDQYILIGGTACDILFEQSDVSFRATKDLDIVLVVEELTSEFGEKIWKFIHDGGYRNKYTSNGMPQFYRFDKPENSTFPKMIELFSRKNFNFTKSSNITAVHIDDEISSLSAILLNDAYYQILLEGRIIEDELSVLRPEYIILFKAKAFLDLSERKALGEHVDSKNIKKHKRDILRITSELMLNAIDDLPNEVLTDISLFLKRLDVEPFDKNLLDVYGLTNEQITSLLRKLYFHE